MTLEKFQERLFKKFESEITDQIFLLIENDKELMQDYLKTVGENGFKNVNQTIGKSIKDRYNLGNLEEEHSPKSKLIQSYTKHFN